MPVRPIPDGFHSMTPYLIVQGVPRLLAFLQQAFDAAEVHVTALPDGTVLHAELRIGGSALMVGEAQGPWSPMPGSIYLYVDDANATYKRALEAGAASLMEPADQFHGDRMGGVKDPSGNCWWIATRIEDLSAEELARRVEQFIQKRAGG